MEPYLDVLSHSVSKNCKLVSKIIAVKIDEDFDGLLFEYNLENLRVEVHARKLFNGDIPFDNHFAQMVCGHAIGMHKAIELCTDEYVWFCDPDVFFLNKADELFINIFEQYDLTAIGVSHFNANEQSYLHFPCAINLLTKKDYLPEPNWMSGKFYVQSGMRQSDNCELLKKVDGMYLIPGPIKQSVDKFPNPQGIFDMGCNLWLWNLQRNGKWVSFYLDAVEESFSDNYGVDKIIYPMNYTSEKYKSNFDLNLDIEPQEILYHRTRGSKSAITQYMELYNELFDANLSINDKKKSPLKNRLVQLLSRLLV